MKLKQGYNFIDNMIIRIDYADIEMLGRTFPQGLRDSIREGFPLQEMRDVKTGNFQLDPMSGDIVSKSTVASKEWAFSSSDGMRRLVFNPGFLSYECRGGSYSGYADSRNNFLTAAKALEDEYQGVTITRLGMRYTNVVTPVSSCSCDGTLPEIWSDTIHQDYLAELSLFEKEDYVRAVSSVEIKRDGYSARLQYGLYNRDYPSINVKTNSSLILMRTVVDFITLMSWVTCLMACTCSMKKLS